MNTIIIVIIYYINAYIAFCQYGLLSQLCGLDYYPSGLTIIHRGVKSPELRAKCNHIVTLLIIISSYSVILQIDTHFLMYTVVVYVIPKHMITYIRK